MFALTTTTSLSSISNLILSKFPYQITSRSSLFISKTFERKIERNLRNFHNISIQSSSYPSGNAAWMKREKILNLNFA